MSGLLKTYDKLKMVENNLSIFVFKLIMKQVFSILLVLILLASHSYLTIGTHFCGGEAVESKILLGETHLGCGMMDREEPCEDYENSNKSNTSFVKTICCKNEYQTVQLTTKFVKVATQIAFSFEFAVAFFYTTLNLDLFLKSTQQFYTEYHSPPLEKDIQVLFQTFLI